MRLTLTLCLLAGTLHAQQPANDEQAANDKLTLELIKRVKDFDMSTASPKVKAAVGRFLEASRGSKEYFDFLDRYKLPEEKDKLLEFALNKAGTAEGADAFKALIKLGQIEAVKSSIATAAPAKVGALLDSLSLTQNREAAELVFGVVKDAKSTPELKSAAVRALGKSRNGENVLLAAVKKNELPQGLNLVAGEVLRASADPATKQAATELLPMPKTQGDKPLPPVTELVSRKGNAENGKTVYGKLCMTCHKVGNEGIDFGPALTEIGTKLPKEAIYTAILEPSAGISFGFEGFEVKTKRGDTYIGMVAGETDAELSLKVPGGIIIKTPKAELDGKKKLEMSLMTPGLAGAVTEQELVDLVEYLSALKKK